MKFAKNILTAPLLKEADNCTIEERGITSLELMEEASKGIAEHLINEYDDSYHFYIFCGLGNNGGDGLAVARILLNNQLPVTVFIIKYALEGSKDFNINYERLKKDYNCKIIEVTSVEDIKFNYFPLPIPIAVDALLGYGLSRPVEGLLKDVISFINKEFTEILSIDIPSGLFCDFNSEETRNCAIKATEVLTIGTIKLALLFPENNISKFTIIPLDIHKRYLYDFDITPYHIIDKSTFKISAVSRFHRKKFSHKGNYGHSLLISGSKGKMGAAVLSSLACLRVGTGLLTTHCPKCGYEIMQTSVPEAMVSTDKCQDFISEIPDLSNYSVVGIGPGLGTETETISAMKYLIESFSKPMVIDADALNILALNPEWFQNIPKGSILTPHPGEFKRLVGSYDSDKEKMEKLSNIAVKYGVFVVLKGTYTAIASPDGTIDFNLTGTPAMATAGSGDVLTGIILGLLAQGFDSNDAAKFGVLIHGMSGQLAEIQRKNPSIIARDIINNIRINEFLRFE